MLTSLTALRDCFDTPHRPDGTGGWNVRCPSHSDCTTKNNPSLHLTAEPDGKLLLYCWAGCRTEVVMAAKGLPMSYLSNGDRPSGSSKIIATYDYEDEHGDLIYQVVRREPKAFTQRRPHPDRAGEWLNGLKAGHYYPDPRNPGEWKRHDPSKGTPPPGGSEFGETPMVVYRLAALAAMQPKTIVVVEGEKDAEALWAIRIPATTNSSGAGKWKESYSQQLLKCGAKTIVLIADNDDAGRNHMKSVAKSFNADVEVLELVLPGLPDKGDVSDWLAAGGTQAKYDELIAAARKAEPWEPPIPLPSAEYGPAFPIEALPAAIRDYAVSVAAHMQVPVDLPAMIALGVCGGALARHVEVEVKPDWLEPLNIWLLGALASGEGKSPAYGTQVRPLVEWEADEAERLRGAIRDALNRREILEARYRVLQTKAAKVNKADEREKAIDAAARAKEELDKCHVPARPQLVADDVTPERGVSLMAEQGGRIIIGAPEGGNFFSNLSRYSGGATNADATLKAHSGDEIRLDRQTNHRSDHIKRPAMTVILAMQPSLLNDLSDNPVFRRSGLLARFAFFLPRPMVGVRDHVRAPSLNGPARDAYGDAVRRLLDIPAPTEFGGYPNTFKLKLDPQALAALLAYRQSLEPELAPQERLEAIADWVNKVAGLTARIAGVLSLLSLDTKGPIPHEALPPVSLKTMANAITIAQYLLEHARVAFRLIGRDRAFSGALRVLEWVHRKGERVVTQRDIFRAHDGTYGTLAELQPSLAILVERYWLRPIQVKTGGRPSPRYEVNPALFTEEGGFGAFGAFPIGGQKGQKPPAAAEPAAPSVPFVPGAGEPVNQEAASHGETCDCKECVPF
jgi:hypothetical protein